MSKIRVGLIRCDTHGLWYGPIMAEHDPMLLQQPMDPALPHHYTWQAGGNHFFFYSHYSTPLKMTAPFVGGFEIVKVWDEHRDAAEQASAVFFGKPKVCDSFEQCSDDVDLVFIADCNYDGSDHLQLATPGLKKGVATFVDKPFADTVKNARAIMELGRKHNAPLFSLSLLRLDPSVASIRNRLPEVGTANFATVQGCGTAPAGLVHSVSIVQHIFGPGIKTLRPFITATQSSIYLDYGDQPDRPPHGVMINAEIGHRDFYTLSASVYGPKNDIHVTLPGDFVDATAEMVRMIKKMVETRQVPPVMDEVLESIAVIEAFKKAKQTGEPVEVAEFL